MVGIHRSPYYAQYTLLGTPMVHTRTLVLHIPPLMVSGCTVMTSWAQDGRKAWVGASPSP